MGRWAAAGVVRAGRSLERIAQADSAVEKVHFGEVFAFFDAVANVAIQNGAERSQQADRELLRDGVIQGGIHFGIGER